VILSAANFGRFSREFTNFGTFSQNPFYTSMGDKKTLRIAKKLRNSGLFHKKTVQRFLKGGKIDCFKHRR
jgi:hypothetical protein